jgi:protein-S-isoprenylcysteine O-methyltransferase Ste14
VVGGGAGGGHPRRHTVSALLLGIAILGAAALMASVLVEDMTWRVALQVAGLATCSVASLALVLTVRRWGAADDFWWPGTGAPGQSVEPAGPAAGRGAALTPETDADR